MGIPPFAFEEFLIYLYCVTVLALARVEGSMR